ncbi:hypothetical protein COL48_28995 [Bacillus toyonensis]|nr:hypothetical protein CON60_23940 [Bacillus toyonensis]PEJ92964.1 hypothetical protein CN687_16880 [Bacillus toyonensis]PEK98640.1 hypothetical protein CN614_31050 [Bacillus toyonensis]PEN33612.1 hypothetical protein CN541_26195 [Bacillus toyonensis]PEO98020.1 hypothetical protein CN577_30870 [Bacillus toyonensis]
MFFIAPKFIFIVLGKNVFLKLIAMGRYPTSINLRYIFIQNVFFPYSFLLSFLDFIKVDISNKP